MPNPEAWSEGNHYKNHSVYTVKKKRYNDLLIPTIRDSTHFTITP